MSDIELVIKIDEKSYSKIKRCTDKLLAGELERAVKNGTPLPKGHGELKDADELKNEIFHGGSSFYKKAELIIDNVSAIIEADKEESKVKENEQ